MSQAMNETIAEYPAETEGTGNQVLEPTVRADGVKEFDLTAEITPWEVEPGGTVDAWTYNGAVPGPQIHVEVGDRVRIVLHNELPMATDLHLHGINVDNAMDGVAPVTQDLVEPGGSFTYEFTADEPAVAMYHAHHHGQLQVPNGMLGTIFVGDMPLPAGQTIGGHTIPADAHGRQELPLVLNDSGVIGYSLNGKSFPATAPIAAARGTGSSCTTSTRAARSTRCTSTSSTRWWWRRTASRWTTPTSPTPSTWPPASGTRCSSTSTNPAPGSGTATSSTTSSATPGCTGWSPRWS